MSPRAQLLTVSMLLLAVVGATRSAVVVTQKDKLFSRSEIRVRLGDSVTFSNDDGVSHDVFSSSAGFEFNLKSQAPGASVSVAFHTRGTAQVRCAFHPKMKLTVVVE